MRQIKPLTTEKAKAKAEDYCAKAEHCTSEVNDKLRNWGISPADAIEIIEELKQGKYIDDARFARAFARDKVRFGHWGLRKVRQALQQKRINSKIINEAFAEIDMDEYTSLLKHALQSKAKTNPDLLTTYEGRTRLFRFALSRGYEPDLISPILKSLLNS